MMVISVSCSPLITLPAAGICVMVTGEEACTAIACVKLGNTAVQEAFGVAPGAYSLTQLRYDLRKMKAHGLLEREGRRYAYRLTAKGIRVAAMFVLFHKRICGPLANTLFQRRPDKSAALGSPIETAYHKADAAIQKLVDLLAA